jgi:CHAD domain-containing protein
LVRQRLVRSRRTVPDRLRLAANGRSLRDGVKRGYRRARKAMDEATAVRAEDLRFHTWRRRVKDHWYQMRLVEGVNGKAHRRVRRLKELQDWLGDDHNLVVLRSVILEAPQRFGDTRAVAVLLGCIDEHQAALRRRAVRRGRQLFAKKPGLFRKQISRWFA